MPINRDQGSKTDRHTAAEPVRIDDGVTHPRLIVVSGMLLGLQVELRDAPVVIGRSSDCELSMPHPSVSRQHCRIWRDADQFFIEDMGSTNRTYLNGKPIQRAELRDGDQVSVGSNAIKFFIGSSLEASYHEELIDLAIYDSLTGFYNRRHFRSLLDEEVERLGKDGGPACLSLLMLDLDHFKQINDRHGHLIGDQVLAGVAQIIREGVPVDAPIGRLGGEEFAVALRGKALVDAVVLAESLRGAVHDRTIDARDQTLSVTLSIGVAQAARGAGGSSELLRHADEQLYRAKQEGRNRVCAGT